MDQAALFHARAVDAEKQAELWKEEVNEASQKAGRSRSAPRPCAMDRVY